MRKHFIEAEITDKGIGDITAHTEEDEKVLAPPLFISDINSVADYKNRTRSTVEKRIEKIQEMAKRERPFTMEVDNELSDEEIIDQIIAWTITQYVKES